MLPLSAMCSLSLFNAQARSMLGTNKIGGTGPGRWKTTQLHVQLPIQRSWLAQLTLTIMKRAWLQQLSRMAILLLEKRVSPATMSRMKTLVGPATAKIGQAFILLPLAWPIRFQDVTAPRSQPLRHYSPAQKHQFWLSKCWLEVSTSTR